MLMRSDRACNASTARGVPGSHQVAFLFPGCVQIVARLRPPRLGAHLETPTYRSAGDELSSRSPAGPIPRPRQAPGHTTTTLCTTKLAHELRSYPSCLTCRQTAGGPN